MANKDPERRAQTRQRLLSSFWNLYADSPLTQIKIRAVTDGAGCNRSTFYEYFESVYDLLDQAEGELLDQIYGYLAEVAPQMGDAGVLEKACSVYRERGRQLDALLGPHGDPTFAVRFRQKVKPLAMEALGLDAQDPASDILAECLLGAMTQSVAYWHQQGRPIDAERLAQLLRAVLIQGVVPTAERLG